MGRMNGHTESDALSRLSTKTASSDKQFARTHHHRLTALPGVEPLLGVFALILSRSLPGVRGGTAVIRLSTATSFTTAAATAAESLTEIDVTTPVDDKVAAVVSLTRLRARNAAIVLSTRASWFFAVLAPAASRGADSSSIRLIPLGCRPAEVDAPPLATAVPYVARAAN